MICSSPYELIKFYNTYDKTLQAKARILLLLHIVINNATNLSGKENKKKPNIILNTVQNLLSSNFCLFQTTLNSK